MTKEVRLFRQTVEKRTTLEYLDHSQQLYDWLIRPLESELIRQKIKTLVLSRMARSAPSPLCLT
jgi:CHAT domain-containing protein